MTTISSGRRAYLADATLVLPGSNRTDSHASGYYSGNDGTGYWLGAVANGANTDAAWSKIVADGVTRTAVNLGRSTDFQRKPDQLIPLARAVLHDLPAWVGGEKGNALAAFKNPRGRGPDAEVVVATATPDAEIVVGWVGTPRCYIFTVGGELFQLTSDHTGPYGNGPTSVTRTLGNFGTDSCPEGAGAGPGLASWVETGHDRARRLLLCTRGLYAPLRDAHSQILTTLGNLDLSARAVAKQLTETAAAAGGGWSADATAMVVDIPSPPTAAMARTVRPARTAHRF